MLDVPDVCARLIGFDASTARLSFMWAFRLRRRVRSSFAQPETTADAEAIKAIRAGKQPQRLCAWRRS